MTRVLLADDDILTINRLLNLIDWEAEGYEIVGQALNGGDCIRLLKATRPDILILDVDMPDKNGVEITMALKTMQLNAKVLILSNYDNFSFVRDAFHYGAYDYLLKHQLTGELLLGKLEELRKLIGKEKNTRSRLFLFTEIAKQKFLYRLITSQDIGGQPEDEMMLAQADFSAQSYCLCVMEIPNFILLSHCTGVDAQKMIDSISNLASSIFAPAGNGLITHVAYGHFVILFHFEHQNSAAAIHEEALRLMRLVGGNIRKLWEVDVTYQISDIFTDILCTEKAYQQTQKALHLHFSPEDGLAEQKMNLQEERDLMNALTAFHPGEVETLLHNVFARMSSIAPTFPSAFLEQLFSIGTRFAENQGLQKGNTLQHFMNVRELAQISSVGIEAIFQEYYRELMDKAPGQGSRRYSSHIQRALLYIQDHYGEEITLNGLAEYLHLSPTHFSRLFHKEVGKAFIDYLVTYRIERAKDLISRTDLDLHLIGEKVGFHSYNYFLRAYKEKTGRTPMQEMRTPR